MHESTISGDYKEVNLIKYGEFSFAGRDLFLEGLSLKDEMFHQQGFTLLNGTFHISTHENIPKNII